MITLSTNLRYLSISILCNFILPLHYIAKAIIVLLHSIVLSRFSYFSDYNTLSVQWKPRLSKFDDSEYETFLINWRMKCSFMGRETS